MAAWIGPLVLGFMVAEAAALLLWHRRTGRGLPPAGVAAMLLPGGCIVVALWVALAGGWWGWIGLALVAALVAHAFDLRRRWPG